MARRQIHSDAISFKIFLYFLLGSYKFYCLFGLDVSVVRDNQDSVIVNLGRNQTGDCSSAIPQSVLYSKSASSLYCVCSKNQYGTYIGTKGCIYDHGTSFGMYNYIISSVLCSFTLIFQLPKDMATTKKSSTKIACNHAIS